MPSQDVEDGASMQKGIDQGYYTMNYEYPSNLRKSRWSLVRDAVDLEMLLHVVDMDSSQSLDPLLGSVSRISLDERSSSPPQGSPPGSYRSESPSDELQDVVPLRRHSCGVVHSEQRQCFSCVRLLCSCAKSDVSIPKSLSLPLRQQTPDPFPELTSPITPSSEPIQMDTSTKSSSSSPNVRQRKMTQSRKISVPASQLLLTTEESPTYDEMNMWAPSVHTKFLVNIFNDESSKTLSIDEKSLASDVVQMMVAKSHVVHDKNWVISETLPKLNLERSLEDHECLSVVQKNWANSDGNKFMFTRDFCKYEVFINPNQFFPPAMMDVQVPDDDDSLLSRTDRYKNLLLQNMFNGDRMPDIQGFMQMKEGKKSWKKLFFILRSSGLYYSSKGTSMDPQHLVLLSHLTDVDVYLVNNPKKAYGAPRNICLCLKPNRIVTDSKELKLLCPEDEQAKICWMSGFRLIKYGNQLRENFQAALLIEERLHLTDSPSDQCAMNVKCRVAMDFTGRGGRVVDDPNEALGVAVEEAHQWRRKVSGRLINSHSPLSGSPKCAGSFLSDNPAVSRIGLSSGLHMAQPWFHSGLSREEAVKIIAKHGLVDGVFLVRESLSIPNAYVLSMAHNHKVKHCQIKTLEFNSHTMVSLDGGHTKFSDLLQLVEFYELNAGGLPCHLTYFVSRLP